MPQPDELPALFLPRNLSAAAAADFVDALHQLIAAMERHYGAQLLRYYHPHDIAQRDLDSAPAPTDPPF
jgi:hypothetical protein